MRHKRQVHAERSTEMHVRGRLRGGSPARLRGRERVREQPLRARRLLHQHERRPHLRMPEGHGGRPLRGRVHRSRGQERVQLERRLRQSVRMRERQMREPLRQHTLRAERLLRAGQTRSLVPMRDRIRRGEEQRVRFA